MPRVLNRKDLRGRHPPGAAYVGRGSIWGNPFVIGRDGSRADVIRKFDEYLCGNAYLMARIDELRGKDLVCFCAPRACHADILLKFANEPNNPASTVEEKP